MPLNSRCMNAIRQIVSPQNGRIWIDVPKEFAQKRFQVIVLPIEETDEPSLLLTEEEILDRVKAIRMAYPDL